MARYMMLWEYQTDRAPVDLKEKKKQWMALVAAVKKQLKSGQLKDYASFAGEAAGYVVVEGGPADVHAITSIYSPFVKFVTKPLMTVEEIEKVYKSL